MADPTPLPTPRKRGAQKGNHNALKHGFYASRPKVKEPVKPNPAGALDPDISLYRQVLLKVMESINDSQAAISLEDHLSLLHLTSVAVARLNGLWQSISRFFATDTSSLFATLRSLGFKEDQLNVEVFDKPKSTQGGQEGNTNALKYGLYTSLPGTSLQAFADADQGISVDDELTLMRIIIRRAFTAFTATPPKALRKNLHALRSFNDALEVVTKLERTKHLAFTVPAFTDIEQYLATITRTMDDILPPD